MVFIIFNEFKVSKALYIFKANYYYDETAKRKKQEKASKSSTHLSARTSWGTHKVCETVGEKRMARCKNCKGIDSFEFIEALDSEKSLYQCANCKRVVSATAEEMNDEYRVI